MAPSFRSVISALWSELQLPAPKFGADNEIVLSIDGTNIELSESADERQLMLTCVAGTLAADVVPGGRQVSALLNEALARMTTSRICISLREDLLPGSRTRTPVQTVIVQAACSYDRARVPDLIALVQDLLSAHLSLTQELTHTGSTPKRAGGLAFSRDDVIFLP